MQRRRAEQKHGVERSCVAIDKRKYVMVRQIKKDELAKEFQKIISGADIRIPQNSLELNDDSYFLSEEQLKECLGIPQMQINEQLPNAP